MGKYVFGVDVGGTTVKMGLFEDNGTLLEKWEIKTDTSNGGANILDDITKSIQAKMDEKKIAKEDVSGVGIGVPGPVAKDGTVFRCVNLGWGEINVKKELEEKLGLSVEVGNDATVAGLGEMWKGGGEGYKNVVLVTLGTGVGGGIIIDGKIVYGTHGASGEIGHMHVNDDEEDVCGCGNKGCLEQYASATGIVRMTKKYLASHDTESSLRKLDVITAKDIFDAAKQGDAVALSLVDDYNKMLGNALAAVSVVVDPEVFVIGGGVSRAGSIITDGVAKYYNQYTFHSCRNVEFKIAKLGNDAGIYGAAKLVVEE